MTFITASRESWHNVRLLEEQSVICVLRVIGDQFDAVRFLASSMLPAYKVFHEVRKQTSTKPRATNGFNSDVSEKETIAEMVDDAIDFLRKYQRDLALLKEWSGVEAAYLDFGYACHLDEATVWVQCDYLPAELLALAGELGIGIKLSLYPILDEPDVQA